MSNLAIRVHLTGSSRNPGNDLPYLRQIINTVHECHGSIVLNWIETAHYKSQDGNASWDWDDIISNNLDALRRAHVVIIEGTNHGLLQGYQLALALQRRLPVLFLTREEPSTLPIAGIKNRLLTVKRYATTAELDKVVTKFMIASEPATCTPAISEAARRFLRSESLITGRTEAEVVDALIHKGYDW